MDARKQAGIKGALVLAAGFSRRFDGGKLTAVLGNGSTVLQQTLQRLSAAATHIVIVTRPELVDDGIFDTGVCHAAARSAGDNDESSMRIVLCEDSHRGMGHTLAFGAAQIEGWDSCLVCLGDMPFIRTATYQQLLAATQPDTIVLPEYEGRTGNPVGFGSRFFAELREAEGDTGGRAIIRTHPEAIERVIVTDSAVLQDIDTPDDLQRFR